MSTKLKTEIKLYFLNSGQIEDRRNGKSPEECVAYEVEDVDSHVLVGVNKLAGSLTQLVLQDRGLRLNHNQLTV